MKVEPNYENLSRELAQAQELLAEVKRQRARLEAEVGEQRELLTQFATERTELRHALINAQRQLHAFLELPVDPSLVNGEAPPAEHEASATKPPRRPSIGASPWRRNDDRRSLGAGLAVTGVMSCLVGLVLHAALQQNVILTEAHLGYIVGLIGVLLFLIGLAVVF